MSALLVLHIIAMTLGFALLACNATLCHAALRSAGPGAARALLHAIPGVAVAGRAAVLLGVALGLALARPFGYTSAWLLWSYGLMVAAIGIGALVIDPLQARLLAPALSAPQFGALARDRRALYGTLANGLLWSASIALMVYKP